LVNFPWNDDNLDEWLYRPVKVKGRQVHRLTMTPLKSYGNSPGFHYVVPVVTQEDSELTYESRKGVLVNKGWCYLGLKQEKEKQLCRPDSLRTYEFTGYVSNGEDHKRFFGNGTNAASFPCWQMDYFYLPEMAKESELHNKDQIRTAVIECCTFDGPMDETDPRHYHGADMSRHYQWPYAKTLSGALQCSNMPWDHRRTQQYWGATGALSFLIGVLAKVH